MKDISKSSTENTIPHERKDISKLSTVTVPLSEPESLPLCGTGTVLFLYIMIVVVADK